MEFLKSLEWPILICIWLFIFLYVLFFYRYKRVSKHLPVVYPSLLVKLIIRGLYLTLIIVSLLGPSFGESRKEIKAIGKDIFICVDLSQSMNATDIPPSRMERMKFEIKNIVNAFSSDRIGLIIFSSQAFVQCPLTFDQSAISLFIETLSTNLLPNASTDFGPPLEIALHKLSEGDSLSTKQSKIILLISDGEDFGEDTDEVAEQLESKGVKLFTLGIGSAKGSKIPLPEGGFKKDKEGNEVNTALTPISLKNLAATTGGKYFEINEKENGVPKMINAINLIEGEVKDVRKIEAAANKYFYFLFAAFLLMILDASLNLRVVKV